MNNKEYKTILVIACGFILLFIGFRIDWLLYVALVIALLSAVSERLTFYINEIWFGIAKVLGWINSRILLSIIYIFLVIPMAFLKRVFGNQSNNLKKKEASYFIERDHIFSKNDFENPW